MNDATYKSKFLDHFPTRVTYSKQKLLFQNKLEMKQNMGEK